MRIRRVLRRACGEALPREFFPACADAVQSSMQMPAAALAFSFRFVLSFRMYIQQSSFDSSVAMRHDCNKLQCGLLPL